MKVGQRMYWIEESRPNAPEAFVSVVGGRVITDARQHGDDIVVMTDDGHTEFVDTRDSWYTPDVEGINVIAYGKACRLLMNFKYKRVKVTNAQGQVIIFPAYLTQ